MKISMGTALIICAVALVPLTTRAEDDPSRHYSALYRECMKHTGLADFKMRYCAQDEQVRQEKALNSTYQKLLLATTDTEKKSALIKAERSWVNYRIDECNYGLAGNDSPPGTLDLLMFADCMLAMTYNRVKDLRDELSAETEFPTGDPAPAPSATKQH